MGGHGDLLGLWTPKTSVLSSLAHQNGHLAIQGGLPFFSLLVLCVWEKFGNEQLVKQEGDGRNKFLERGTLGGNPTLAMTLCMGRGSPYVCCLGTSVWVQEGTENPCGSNELV